MVPFGGAATVVVAEPEGCVVTVQPVPEAMPAEQEYEMESDIPTSAVCGWQERVAVSGPPVPVPTVIVTEEVLLVAVYVPAVLYVWEAWLRATPALCALPVPSPKSMEVPTPLKLTASGGGPDVGVAVSVPFPVPPPPTVIVAVPRVAPEESRSFTEKVPAVA